MPFYTQDAEWRYAPEGSDEWLNKPAFCSTATDEDHLIFRNSQFCTINMFETYYSRQGQFPPAPPRDWIRNWGAVCYNAPPRRANPPPPPQGLVRYEKKDVAFTGSTKTPYFMPYDDLDEINLRLAGSVIRLDGELVVVDRVNRIGRANNRFDITFINAEDQVLTHEYGEGSGFDLSPLPPRYGLNENKNRKAVWIFRKPVRGVYRQGATRGNTFFRNVGSRVEASIGNCSNIMTLYKRENEVRSAADVVKVLSESKISAALSDHIALMDDSKHAVVEYHGMKLGKFRKEMISNGVALFKPAVEVTPWMEDKLAQVGLSAVNKEFVHD